MISGHVSGLAELDSQLAALGANLGGKTLRSGARAAMKPVRDSMLAHAPQSSEPRIVKRRDESRVEINPGFLKSRIKIRTRLNRRAVVNRRFQSGEIVDIRVGVFKIPYVVQQEFGTTKQRANPFIRPALENNHAAIIRELKKQLKKGIRRTVRRQRRIGNNDFNHQRFDALAT